MPVRRRMPGDSCAIPCTEDGKFGSVYQGYMLGKPFLMSATQRRTRPSVMQGTRNCLDSRLEAAEHEFLSKRVLPSCTGCERNALFLMLPTNSYSNGSDELMLCSYDDGHG